VCREVMERLRAGQRPVQVAKEMALWPSTVYRILRRSRNGDCGPRPRGNARKDVQETKRIKLMFLYALWMEDKDRELSSYVAECRRVFGSGSPSHICDLLRYDLHLRIRRSIYEHPNKWIAQGAVEYYQHYLYWVRSLNLEQRLRLKFMDEVRVDRTCLGRQDSRAPPLTRGTSFRHRLHDGETYTINLMVCLDQQPFIIYNIIDGSSNGYHYAQFIVNVAGPTLAEDDILIVDNVRFHIEGSPAYLSQAYLDIIGVHYYSLPPYSPELNPVELVFSYLKRCLQYKHDFEEPIQTALDDCLSQIKPHHIYQFYKHRNYV